MPADKITVLLNAPSLERFDRSARPERSFMADGTLRLVYAGALTPTYELDVALRGVAGLAAARPGLSFCLDVYGRGDSEASLGELAAGLGIGDRVSFHGRIPIEAVPAAVAAADIGLAPTRRDEFTDFSLSTKIFEYGAMGKPVVASRLPMVERTFPPGSVTTYESGNPADLTRAVLAIVDDPAGREAAVERTMGRIRELSWEHEADRLMALIDRLARDVPLAPA